MPRPTIAALEEQIARQQQGFREAIGVVTEAIAELELDLEDKGWQRLKSGDSDFTFSREALRTITRTSRLLFLKNPLIRRAVLTRTDYVFGQGMTIKARNPKVDEIVQAFLADDKNKHELTAMVAQQERDQDLQVEANIFFVFFTNTNGDTRIRTIVFDEIEQVIANPEDRREPWFYLRHVTTAIGKEEYTLYPDFQYRPQVRPATYKVGDLGMTTEIRVEWDHPVYHVRVNPSTDSAFGVSELYAAQDWATAYNEFLSNWATIVRSYARWAWKLTAKAAKIPAIKAQLESRIGSTTGQSVQPAPSAGSIFASETTDLQPLRTQGATTSMEDGRYLRLMVCSATGIFEHYLTGDPSTGNLATSKSMERPMELSFLNRQRFWQAVWEAILLFVIERKAEAGTAGITGGYVAPADDPWQEHRFVFDPDPDDELTEAQEPADVHVDIIFPSIVEHDMAVEVAALVQAATLGGWPMAGTLSPEYLTRQLLIALGEQSVEETMAELFPPETDGETTTEAKLSMAIDRLRAHLLREAKREG
jgi:hypothetical protein